MSTVAFLGLGHMGTPMALRLLGAGHEVVVWNRSADRAASTVAAGARAAATAAEAAGGAEVVITMLADPPAVEAVISGPDGVASGIRSGACLVEMSTIGPELVRALPSRLPSGVAVVDAPVLGSVPQATNGALTVLAGGTEPDLDRVEPMLTVLGRVVRCGPLGTAAAAKLVVNAAIIVGLTGCGEALALAGTLGLPRQLTLDVLAGTPVAALVRRLFDEEAYFAVPLAIKDLGLAASAEPGLALIQAARERLVAAETAGAGEADVRRVAEHVRAG